MLRYLKGPSKNMKIFYNLNLVRALNLNLNNTYLSDSVLNTSAIKKLHSFQ